MTITPLSITGFDPLDFFAKLSDRESHPVFIRHDNWITIAWNPSQIVECRNQKDWSAFDQLLKDRSKHLKTDLPFIGGAIGCIPYDISLKDLGVASRFQSTSPAPIFFLYDQLIAWNQKQLFVIGDKTFQVQVKNIHERSAKPMVMSPLNFQPQITKVQYARSFAKAKRAILDGEFYQLNLAHQLEGKADVDPLRLFCELAKTQTSIHISYLDYGAQSVLSFSPERFIRIDQHKILTSPIKGTAPRGKNKKDDTHNRSALIASEKEKAELSMITDLLRNDIGQVSTIGSVKVLSARKVQKNAAVWHTYSEITGILDDKFSHLQALRSCLPAGSITGCPKKRACEYIDTLEWAPRGMYTGIVVAFSDHGVTDSSIIIRTIIAQKNKLTLSVGGGIVFDSDCEHEWQETFDKAAPFLRYDHCDEILLINGVPTMITDELRWSFDAENPQATGVFETLRVDNAKIIDCDEHLRRLKKSAAIIGMSFTHSLKNIARDAHNAVALCRSSSLRMKIVATEKNILIHCTQISRAFKKTVSAITVPLERSNPTAKSLPYDDCYKAHHKAVKSGYDEALLVDRNGCITEGAYSNIFWIKGGVLHTPDANILRGITRKKVLHIARKKKISIKFCLPTKKELLNADGVFIASSIVGIRPVSMIDEKSVQSKNGILKRIMQSCI